MNEELDEFPEALKGQEVMPWERPGEPPVWHWGADKGKRLDEIPSRELVRKRNWLERDREAFKDLIAAIDAVLIGRAGE